MSETTIPTTLMQSYGLAPRLADVALLMRHAHRPPIAPGTYGDEVLLSEPGVLLSEELGAMLSSRPPGGIVSSPVPRCVATAEAMARGANWSTDVTRDWRLGVPGPFVVEPSLAGPLFLEFGPVEVVKRQLTQIEPLPGIRPTSEGVELLLDLMTQGLGNDGWLNVFVTHDSVLAAIVGSLQESPLNEANWPEFLEGLFVWRSSEGLEFSWRGCRQGPYPSGG